MTATTKPIAIQKHSEGIWKVDADFEGFDIFVVHQHIFDSQASQVDTIKRPVAYLLLGYSSKDKRWSAYAGRSQDKDVSSRLRHHNGDTTKPWSTGVIAVKGEPNAFTESECTFLELEFYELLEKRGRIDVLNKNKPSGDPQISRSRSRVLSELAKTVLNVAEMLGLPSDHIVRKDASTEVIRHSKPVMRKFWDASTEEDKHMIGEHEGQTATIYLKEANQIECVNKNGKVLKGSYTSLSDAQKRIFSYSLGTNAWDFWRIEGSRQTARERYHEIAE